MSEELEFSIHFNRNPTYASSGPLIGDEPERDDPRVEDWTPPIPGSRNANCYYSAFHNVTAMVGVGVLDFPYSMSKLGWVPGILVLTLSWIITLYTLVQMVQMHESVDGRRFDRYHELGQEAFGDKYGLWVVVPQQLMVEVGVDIVYMVTGGQSLQNFYKLVCKGKHHKSFCLPTWILIFSLPQFVLSQLPNLNAISGVSLAAAIMSFGYSTIAWGASIKHLGCRKTSHHYKFKTTANAVFQAFSALGTIAFGYAGHNVVLEIQATLPSTRDVPSKKAMLRGVVVAYIIVFICYFLVAILGYSAFGNVVSENILDSLQNPIWLNATANLMVVVHVIGGYQVYAMPVFDMMENLAVTKFHFQSTIVRRLVVRSIYVAFTCFVAATFPFFSDLLGFFGGFGFASTTYFLPCIMWLRIRKPARFGPSWLASWACIILGVLLMFASLTGGLREIIVKSSNYKFYHCKNASSEVSLCDGH